MERLISVQDIKKVNFKIGDISDFVLYDWKEEVVDGTTQWKKYELEEKMDAIEQYEFELIEGDYDPDTLIHDGVYLFRMQVFKNDKAYVMNSYSEDYSVQEDISWTCDCDALLAHFRSLNLEEDKNVLENYKLYLNEEEYVRW